MTKYTTLTPRAENLASRSRVMPLYRRKITFVDAQQFFPDQQPWPPGVSQDTASVCDDPQCGDSTWDHHCTLGRPIDSWYVVTAHGQKTSVVTGDWILPEPEPGRAYPVKPAIFAATYERLEESPPCEKDGLQASAKVLPAPGRYILNSAVLTAWGLWEYSPITPSAARNWLLGEAYSLCDEGHAFVGDECPYCPPEDAVRPHSLRTPVGPCESTIGDTETVRALEFLCGLPENSIPVNRETIHMEIGDQALVCRLLRPIGSLRIDLEDTGWELGLLVREG